ncbi:DNA translocase FtsK [Aureibacillus halotolerans]|uniref:S-DNA-T family DNA segregation ATPase FtsK/SpoIIIE n=1 Tax=Aureibacillus halotolerans TaxID=1508390 RepID=A0A4R6U3S2_9BACI|nr:DNA translocase FtsK [Aureibacillus halotolerans]TDQ39075.1 S-DNA-T family DNA segregation ATPase FtsK/SpoIIIE [Aureibacillus halotolerans]
MSNWFKRFFEKEDVDDVHLEMPNEQKKYRKDEFKARVTFQYPQGQFRFPVIPDRASRGSQRSNSETAPPPKVERSEKPTKETKPSSVVGPKSSGTKKPFQPTDVPSPIYGFKQRKSSEEIEHKKDEIVPFPSARRRKLKRFSELEVEAEHSRPITKTEAPQPVTQDTSLNLVVPVKRKNDSADQAPEKETVSPAQQPNIYEQKASDEVEKMDSEQKEENRTPAPVIEEKPIQKQVEPISRRKKSASDDDRKAERDEDASVVPFNVVMLNRDKQQLKDGKQLGSYQHPSLQLLNVPPRQSDVEDEWVQHSSEVLNATLANFNVEATVVDSTQGPTVTRFEIQPSPGVKVNKVTNLQDDLKLSLAAKDIRIEAPIPGKSTIGIEVPNRSPRAVLIREILRTPEFLKHSSPLAVALGLDIAGQPIVTDLHRMPHGLIAGATGSGKSVCINAILISLLYKATPDEVRLMLIDPKIVELAPYNEVPHLVSPVITDVKAATAALKWAVEEMEERYTTFAENGVRDISRYNEKFAGQKPRMPYLVIVIDELADLMMAAPQDVEEAIARIAQKARACGIHLLVATQRPSVDVITGLIKANIPTRIAFSVSSQIDSRTILDGSGAERLLGKGDMLFLENGSSKPFRLQGLYVSDDEIDEVVTHVKKQAEVNYLFNQKELIEKSVSIEAEDDLFEEACLYVLEQNSASASALQRRFRIGYNRAARLIDMMEEKGIISGNKGSKPRDLLVTSDQLNSYF